MIQNVFPDVFEHIEFPDEYYDELNVYRAMRDSGKEEFKTIFNEFFLNDEHFTAENSETINSKDLARRNALKDAIYNRLYPEIFYEINPDSNYARAHTYVFTDVNNENTAHGPYVIVGTRVVILILRQWLL